MVASSQQGWQPAHKHVHEQAFNVLILFVSLGVIACSEELKASVYNHSRVSQSHINWRGCSDANFISVPCFPLTPILTYVQVHPLPIQSEHNASTVRKSAFCVRAFRLIRTAAMYQDTYAFSPPIRSSMLLAAALRSLSPMLFHLARSTSQVTMLSPNITCFEPLQLPPGQTINSHVGNWQKPWTLLRPPISCPRARKEKRKVRRCGRSHRQQNRTQECGDYKR